MINKATDTDIIPLSAMFMAMYQELYGVKASTKMDVFIGEVIRCLDDPTETVYIDSEAKGFFIVKNITEILAPEVIRYQGTRVYIKPPYRKSRVLKEFYDRLFKDFPDGTILGSTEANSEHIKVLDKRHKLIHKVYELIRS